MESDLEVESFWAGILWGIVITVTLIRFETWLRRTRPPAVTDPFEAMRWEMHRSARQIIEGTFTDAAE